jgi:hypothetical protein
MFGSDERLGVPGTLHRISAMRDRVGGVAGLTYRIGRHVPGVALMLGDVLAAMKASLMPDTAAHRCVAGALCAGWPLSTRQQQPVACMASVCLRIATLAHAPTLRPHCPQAAVAAAAGPPWRGQDRAAA